MFEVHEGWREVCVYMLTQPGLREYGGCMFEVHGEVCVYMLTQPGLREYGGCMFEVHGEVCVYTC